MDSVEQSLQTDGPLFAAIFGRSAGLCGLTPVSRTRRNDRDPRNSDRTSVRRAIPREFSFVAVKLVAERGDFGAESPRSGFGHTVCCGGTFTGFGVTPVTFLQRIIPKRLGRRHCAR